MSLTRSIPGPSTLPARIARPRRRHLAALVIFVTLAAGVVWVGSTQSDMISASLGAMSRADPWLVAVGVALVAMRYAAAAWSLQAASPRSLPFGGTLAVQLGAAAVGRVTPEAIGWLVLNARFLHNMGLEAASATAAITLKLAAGAVARLVFAAVVAWSAATGSTDLDGPDIPVLVNDWAVPTALVVTGLVVLGLRRSRRVRSTIDPALRDLAALRHDRARAASLGVSSLLLSVLPAATLAISAAAVGATLPIAAVFAVYLVGSALAAVSPTPGNLGALELTLSAGLTAAGADAPDALATVLVYRLLTFWLPTLPGLFAFRYAQKSGYL